MNDKIKELFKKLDEKPKKMGQIDEREEDYRLKGLTWEELYYENKELSSGLIALMDLVRDGSVITAEQLVLTYVDFLLGKIPKTKSLTRPEVTAYEYEREKGGTINITEKIYKISIHSDFAIREYDANEIIQEINWLKEKYNL